MIWQKAKEQALKRIAHLPLPAGRLDGLTVQLFQYDNENTLRFEQGPLANLEDHRVVICALARLLRGRGATVRIIQHGIDGVICWKANGGNE